MPTFPHGLSAHKNKIHFNLYDDTYIIRTFLIAMSLKKRMIKTNKENEIHQYAYKHFQTNLFFMMKYTER